MGRVLVTKGTVQDGRISALEVRLAGAGTRTLTRDQAIAWMRDGHSFLPSPGVIAGRALALVEVDSEFFIRDDHAATAADSLPELPPA